jgi:hypothetical protein
MGFPDYPQQFQVYRYRFHIVARDTLWLPAYKGSTLRGGFGQSFQDLVCSQLYQDCQTCAQRLCCMYIQVFQTPALGIIEHRPQYQDAPHPFVIRPPLATTKEYAPGDGLSFGLLLIGHAGQLLPFFIRSFEKLGEIGIGKGRGRYWLEKVEDAFNPGSVVFARQQPQVALGKPISFQDLASSPPPLDKIRINMLTPLRIIHEGRVCSEPSFALLMKNLLRRISMLNLYYGEKWDADFGDILAAAQKIACLERHTEWLDWERHSQQKGRMQLGGIVGQIVFTGELSPFMPFLRMGEHIHIGKVTSMGLGEYRCEEV